MNSIILNRNGISYNRILKRICACILTIIFCNVSTTAWADKYMELVCECEAVGAHILPCGNTMLVKERISGEPMSSGSIDPWYAQGCVNAASYCNKQCAVATNSTGKSCLVKSCTKY